MVKSYLRSQWPLAPEEYITAAYDQLCSSASLTQIATSLEIDHVIRTGEFPPDQSTLVGGLLALVAVLDSKAAEKFGKFAYF